jgi:disulfide bond formation protein DsbB
MAGESTVSPILAALALAAVFGSLLTLTAAELPSADRLRELLHDHSQKAMMVVAVVATCSSLYYSEAVGFTPCEFCWFQRIIMYPLAVLLVTAIVTRTRLGPQFIVVLAVIGLGLSAYHYQLQLFPAQGEVCSAGGEGVPCSGKYIEEFGFITIPFMAGCGFLTILLLQLAEWRVRYLFRRWEAEAA